MSTEPPRPSTETAVKTYLVRHGAALSKNEDPERPLSPSGRAEIDRVALHAVERGVEVVEIRHSGKRRAEQTAQILATRLAPPNGALQARGLLPNDDVAEFASELCRLSEPVMLVGHLPFLDRLAGYLATGDAHRTPFSFGTGSLVCLERRDGAWSISWSARPEAL